MKTIRNRQIKQWGRQLLSFFLVIALVLGLIPSSAYATGESEVGNVTEIVEGPTEISTESRTQAVTEEVAQADTASKPTAKAWMQDERLMANDYIALFVQTHGTLALGTTGGNPENGADDNAKLLCGYPNSATSHSTLRVNGESIMYSTYDEQFDPENASHYSDEIIKDIKVVQKASFVKNGATGREDIMELRYTVTNVGSTEKNVGFRIMFDTMVGENDSAPFWIPGHGAVTLEREFEGEDIPQLWQVFDTLSEPGIVAQGRFYRTESERPDKVQFANWRRLTHTPWELELEINSGIGDSAVAAFWYEKPLAVGESREYVTYYGLSDITQDTEAPLALGVYSESELLEENGVYVPNPFVVNAYVENVGEETAKAVSMTLELPKGLQLADGGEATTKLGDIEVRKSLSNSWSVEAIPTYVDRDYKIRVVLDYDNGSTKSVMRTVHVPAMKETQKEVPRALTYTLFSEDTDKNLEMYGWKSYITGDVYTGKSYIYNGSILELTGKVDAVESVNTNGWQIKVDQANEGVEPVIMPDLEADITGKLSEYDTYKESKTFTESNITMDKSIVGEQDITFAGTTFTGKGYVIADGNITCNLNQGSHYNDETVVMYSKEGDITLNGSELYLDGILYAPNGTVSINANIFHLKGRIIAKHIVMNASQVHAEGQVDDIDAIYEETASDEKGRFTRVYTTDTDFAEGTFDNVSQRVDDSLVLEKTDSETVERKEDVREYDATKEGIGFTLCDTIDKIKFFTGNEKATLTYKLKSLGGVISEKVADLRETEGVTESSEEETTQAESMEELCETEGASELTSEATDVTEEEDTDMNGEVAVETTTGEATEETEKIAEIPAGRQVIFETTLLHGDALELDRIFPQPAKIIENEDGSVTLQWMYDRLVTGDDFTYEIPLTYKNLTEEGVLQLTRDTALLYYDVDGNPHMCYLEDRYVTVSDSVAQGTWEIVCDAKKKNTDWSYVSWNGIRPDDSDITVEVAVSDDGESFTNFVKADNEEPLSDLHGRYLKVRAVLTASTTGITPKLLDLTVSTEEIELVANASPVLSEPEIYETVVGKPVSVILSGMDDAKGERSTYTITWEAEELPVIIEKEESWIKKVTFREPGTYELLAKVTDGEHIVTQPLSIIVREHVLNNIGEEEPEEQPDGVCPFVEVTQPQAGMSAEGIMEVTGTVNDETELACYTLSYRNIEETSEHQFGYGEEPVMDGVLGRLDTEELEKGTYIVTLIAMDLYGNQTIVTRIIRLEKGVDTTMPVIGITGVAFNEDKTVIVITGEASDDVKLARYTLTLVDEEGNETTIFQGTEEKKNETLAELATEALAYGNYTLLLEAEDSSGNHTSLSVSMTYSGEEKTEGDGEQGDSGEAGEDSSEVITGPVCLKTNFKLITDHLCADVGEAVHVKLIQENIQADTIELTVNGEPLTLEDSFAYVVPEKTGRLVFVATAVDNEGIEVSATAVCHIYDSSDTNPPTVAITSPTIDQVLTKPVDIVGSAYDAEELDFWKLEYRLKGEEDYQLLAEGTKPKKDEVLAHFDTTMLMNGQYEVKLTVQDKGGNIRRLENDYVVEGELKVGAMHIGFTDITANMGGTTVSVNRVYDSRNKAKGDFGYGWNLGMQGMTLTESGNIAEGYELVKSGSIFSTGYQMTETISHDVVVSYGDGTSDRFELTFTPERRALVPISEVELGYKCVTNQKVKLEIVGDTTAYVAGTELSFYNEEMYDTLNYKLTTEEGNEIYLNSKDGVYKVVDSVGNVITVDEDGYHSEDGRSIVFTRDEEGRVIKATDPTGKDITYEYDEAGDLVAVTDAANRTVTFTYDKKHNLMSITDPMGIAVARNEYDDEGRLVATIDADGNRVEYDYDVEGRTQAVKDKRGNTTVYTYDDNGNILRTVDAYGNKTDNTYDAYNNLLTTTDAKGNTTSYAYDASGNVTQVTAPDGTKVESTYTQENYVSGIQMMDKTVMAMEYDDKGRLSSVEDANGNVTEYDYTSDGKLTGLTDEIGTYQKVTYDDKGNVATTTNGAGESASYTYDEDGRCTSVTISREENGETLTFTSYYSYNAVGDITQSIDNAGNITKYDYDANGNQTASTDAKGRRIGYTYDDLGNMTKVTYPDGTFETFTYDANGNNITATDRNGLTVTMSYDKLDRMTEKKYADGTKESYVYDEVGNVTEQVSTSGAKTTYGYDNRNRNTSITDTYGKVTTFEYDESARLMKRTDALGNAISYEYDDNGNITKTTYADGNSVTSEYDARNRVTKQEDQYGNETKYEYDGADRLTKVTDAYDNSYSYGYDANGNLVTVTDANEHVTRYAYDDVGRVATVTNALGKTMSYSYDEVGNIKEFKDYAGTVTTYSYDDMDRLVEKKVGSEKTTYVYDDKGQLTKVTDKSGDITYGYDKYGRLTSQTDVKGVTISYSYDKAGRLETFNNGFGTTTYEYDLLDRVTRVIDRNGKATVYEYDELGNRSAVRYPNGNVVTYTYDACQRLKEEWIVNESGVTLAKYTYGLGKAGERTSITELSNGIETETTYKYDKLNRLIKETIERNDSSIINEFEYDAASNRISKETTVKGDVSVLADVDNEEIKVTEGKTTYTYNALNQLVTESSEDGIITYTFDDNGNLIKQSGDKAVDYSYDKENHLLRATIQKGNSVTIESYTYDYAGNRTSKTINETDTTYYVNDTSSSLTMVVAETDKDGKETASYTRGDELLSMERDGEVWYYLYDGHGSVRTLTDEAGRVTDRYAYDAYGNLLEKEGDSKNEFLYTGEQYNANTGLYYLRARYMNPSTGTFISMDSYQGSIYDPVTLHKYLYANANSVMYTDPSGYFSLAECSISTSIQSTLNSIHQINSLRKIIKWADAMCTVYDVAMEIRNVILGGGSAVDVIGALLKGVVVGFMVDGMCKTSLGIVLKPMMAIFGLGDQVDQIQEAIKEGNTTEIAVKFVQLACMLFGLTSQCFTGDTLVSTETGLRLIEEIQIGDYVWSEDTETGEKELKQVIDVSVTMTNVLVYVTTEDGTIINTTENHPFYVEGKGWCAAAELETGDTCRTKDGQAEVVASVVIEEQEEPVKVYNLTIEDNHTYYVSIDKVLVHNEGCGTLSNNNKKHIKQHTYEGVKEQASHLSDEQIVAKLEKDSFFNPDWSLDKVYAVVEEAINVVKKDGKTGLQTVEIDGEMITVFFKENGIFDTAYGTYKFTLEDFK